MAKKTVVDTLIHNMLDPHLCWVNMLDAFELKLFMNNLFFFWLTSRNSFTNKYDGKQENVKSFSCARADRFDEEKEEEMDKKRQQIGSKQRKTQILWKHCARMKDTDGF